MWPSQSNVSSFYGKPDGTATWEAANLVSIIPPFRVTYDGKPVRSIRIHRKCAASLRRVYASIWEAYDHDQTALDETGFTKFGGSYNFRKKRGGNSLSMHSYGCAVDHDPAANAMGNPSPSFATHPLILAAFAREGWEWGGDWTGKSRDGMHWQAATTGNHTAAARIARASVSDDHPQTARPGSGIRAAAINGEVAPEPAWSIEDMRAIQARLRDIGYDPKGVDGRYGPLTAAAVARMHVANGTTGSATGIERATANFIRDSALPATVQVERARATAAVIAEKIPEAAAARRSFFASVGDKLVGFIVGTVAIFREQLGDTVTAIKPVTDALGDIPRGVVMAGLGIIGVVAILTALRAARASEDAYREGKL